MGSKKKPTKPFKDALCAHRRAGKLTGKERTAQKVARMDYTDKMAAANTGSGEAGGPVRKNKKHALRMAKRRAKAAYREENMAVFDMYGRLLKYGLEPLEVECKFAAGAADGAPPACKVTRGGGRSVCPPEVVVPKPTRKSVDCDKETKTIGAASSATT